MSAATVVDVGALWQTIVAALVSGIGVTLVFSIAVAGAARLGAARRDGRALEAALLAALTVVAFALTAAAIIAGLAVMVS